MVQPSVQIAELAVEVGGEPVRGRDNDAELTQRPDAQADRVGETGPVGQAEHLHRGRIGTLQDGGAQPLDHLILLVRLLKASQAV